MDPTNLVQEVFEALRMQIVDHVCKGKCRKKQLGRCKLENNNGCG
jgi:hypothetical protein